MYADNDEQIWNEWVTNFKQAFADTASADQAYADLAKLEMRGDEIDEYLAAFEHLRLKAEWERGAHRTLEVFKKGLPRRVATRPYPGHDGRMDSGGSARNSEEVGPSQPRTAKRKPDGQKRPPEGSAKKKTTAAAAPAGPRRDGRRCGNPWRRKSQRNTRMFWRDQLR